MTQLTRIQGYAHVAIRYGLEEAIFLDAIVHWWRVNKADDRHLHDGRWWTFNSIKAFAAVFPWWSPKQLRRITESCKNQGAVLTGNYNKDARDRTIWYSPSDELLSMYGENPDDSQCGLCICPDGHAQLPVEAHLPAQMGKSLNELCYTHVINNNDMCDSIKQETQDCPQMGPGALRAILDLLQQKGQSGAGGSRVGQAQTG